MNKEKGSLIFMIASIGLLFLSIWFFSSVTLNENNYNENTSGDENTIAIAHDSTRDLPWEDNFSYAIKTAIERNNFILIQMHLQNKSIDYEGKYNIIGKNDSEFMMDVYFRLFVMGNETIKSYLTNKFVLCRMPYPSDHYFEGIELKEPSLLLIYDPTSRKIIKQASINYSTFAPDYMNTSTKKAEIEDIENKTLRFSNWLKSQ
ncbi:hypothetical protein V7O61_00160 [Methanolobus sp. WCC1]|uniref:hypothetical protein n=1 Tax=unclassified Methanolobus TaxID=2629569 RepID=UPI00324D2889